MRWCVRGPPDQRRPQPDRAANPRSIEGATIVIDVNDAEGATLRAATDYAACRAERHPYPRRVRSQSDFRPFDDRQGKREEWDKRFRPRFPTPSCTNARAATSAAGW